LLYGLIKWLAEGVPQIVAKKDEKIAPKGAFLFFI